MNKPIAEMKDRLREAMAMRNKRPADLVNALGIPKSAISQYLSGNTKGMDSERLYKICNYLNVNFEWMLGYDVPMGRLRWEEVTDEVDKESDVAVDTTIRLGSDEDFREIVKMLLYEVSPEQLANIRNMLSGFLK